MSIYIGKTKNSVDLVAGRIGQEGLDLPIASKDSAGVVKVGEGLNIDESGLLSVSDGSSNSEPEEQVVIDEKDSLVRDIVIYGHSEQETREEVPMQETDEEQILTVSDVNVINRLQISGNSWQETRSGKNLIDITKYVNELGSGTTIIDSNKYTLNVDELVDNRKWQGRIDIVFDNLDKNTNYVVSCNYELNVSPYVIVNDNINKTTIVEHYIANYPDGISFNTGDCESIKIIIYACGVLSDTVTGILTISNIQLEKGTTRTAFELYGAMPSPEFPSEIRSCGDNVNLFDESKWDLTDNDNGKEVLKFNGYYAGGTGVKSGNPLDLPIDNLKKGETYTISGKFKSNVSANQLTMMFKDYSIKYYPAFKTDYEDYKITFTVPTDKEILHLYIAAGSPSYYNFVEKGTLKLQRGLATPWTPYNCGNVNFLATHNNLLKPTWAQDLLDRLNVQKTDQNNCITEIDSHRYFKYVANLGYNTGLNYFAKDCFKPNTQYTFKCILMRNNDSLDTNIIFVYTDETYSASRLEQSVNMKPTEYIFTSNKDKTVKYIQIAYSSGATYIDLDNCILYEGTEDLPYEGYGETYCFPLQEGQSLSRLKINNNFKEYANYIDENGQAWVCDYLAEDGIHKKTQDIVMTENNFGNSGYNSSTNGWLVAIFYIQYNTIGYTLETTIGNEGIGYCNLLKTHPETTGDEGFRIKNNDVQGQELRLSILKETIGCTLESTGSEIFQAMKEYVKEHEIRFLLPRTVTEEVIPYTPEQQEAYNQMKNIEIYDSMTIYSNDSDEVSPYLKLYYNYIPAMPSPEAPSEIKSVGDDINLYNPEEMPLQNGLMVDSSKIGTNASGNYVILSIVGGNTYTVSRKNTGVLYVATTEEYPADNVVTIDTRQGSNATNKVTINTSKNANYLFVVLLTNNNPSDEDKENAIEKLKIQEGAKATAYSEYGKGTVEIVKQCKNLFDINDKQNFSNEVTVDEDNWITINYDNTSGSGAKWMYYSTNVSKQLKPSTEYLIVFEIKKSTIEGAEGKGGSGLVVTDGGSNLKCQFEYKYYYTFDDLASGDVKLIVQRTRENMDGCTIMLGGYCAYDVGVKGSITFRISVLEDITITENNFTYGGQKVIVQTKPLRSLPNGIYDVKDKEKTIRKVVERIVSEKDNITLDGYSINNVNNLRFNLPDYPDLKPVQGSITGAHIMSNLFRCISDWTKDLEQVAQLGKHIVVGINRSKLETQDVNGFKKWLKQQEENGTPFTLYYEMTEPVIEENDEIEKSCYEEVTKMRTNNDGDTTFSALSTVNPNIEVNIYTRSQESLLIEFQESQDSQNALIAEMQKELEKLRKHVYELDVTTNWTGEQAPYTQSITLEGVTADDIVNVYPLWSGDHTTRVSERKEFNKIDMVTSSDGSIILTCDSDKPTMALKIRVEV